jgi:hypothetical protein
MSTDSGKGSSGKSDDVLMAILKRLDAMDGKLQTMDKRLLAMEKIGAKVSSLEASTADLGAQQDTLAAAVERIDLAHTELNVKVARVETAHHNPPPNCRQPANGRRCPEEDDDTGGDFVSTTHKLEFPKYDGTDDPLPWLNRCERYFHVRHTPEQKRVALVACYLLDDAQIWFHRMELNGGRPTWTQFVQLVNARFGPPLTDSPLGALAMLRRSGSVDEFNKQFMALSCRDPSITEPQQIQLFITGLGDPLRTDVAL